MIKVLTSQYSVNTLISAFLASLLLVPLFIIFGNTIFLWTGLLLVGLPHFIIAALGYLASANRAKARLFLLFLGLGIGLFLLYLVLPNRIADMLLLLYFIWHMLSDELTFESTIVHGDYKMWQTSWPTVISWGMTGIILLALLIAGLSYLGFQNFVVTILLLVVFLLLSWRVFLAIAKYKNQQKVPWGFLTYFVAFLIPVGLVGGNFWNGEFYALAMTLVIYHLMAWYVFYTKRLIRFPKKDEQSSFRKIFFGWRKGVREFWVTILVMQVVAAILLIIYLNIPTFSNFAGFFVAPFWAPLWIIAHVTTSFLPNRPIGLPRVSNVFGKILPRFSQV